MGGCWPCASPLLSVVSHLLSNLDVSDPDHLTLWHLAVTAAAGSPRPSAGQSVTVLSWKWAYLLRVNIFRGIFLVFGSSRQLVEGHAGEMVCWPNKSWKYFDFLIGFGVTKLRGKILLTGIEIVRAIFYGRYVLDYTDISRILLLDNP